jgi:hypothetical protein
VIARTTVRPRGRRQPAREVQVCDLRRAVGCWMRTPADPPFPALWLSTGTGRGAMTLILRYLLSIGILGDKNTPVLVPRWLCISLLQSVRKLCAPTLDLTAPARAVLLYHQYGFPQDLDAVLDECDRRGLVAIEDCANLWEGTYRGKRLGTFGLAAIFSLSKLFPSVWGGGLATLDQQLHEFARAEQRRLESAWISLFLHLAKFAADRTAADGAEKGVVSASLEMAYAVAERAQHSPVADRVVAAELGHGAFERRRRNYRLLRDGVGELPCFDHLELEGVVPFVAPLLAGEERLTDLVGKLRVRGFYSDVQHFDLNRNLFNPNFRRCALIPVHQGLGEQDMDEICSVIRGAYG